MDSILYNSNCVLQLLKCHKYLQIKALGFYLARNFQIMQPLRQNNYDKMFIRKISYHNSAYFVNSKKSTFIPLILNREIKPYPMP